MKGTRESVILLLLAVSLSSAQVSVSLPNVSGKAGTSLTIPLSIGNVTGMGVTAFQFVLTYDTSIVRLTGIESAGTFSASFTTVSNSDVPGQLIVASAGITPIVGAGTLIYLKADLRNVGVSNLSFSSFKFNEGSPSASPVNGKISVQKVNRKPVFVYRIPSGPIILTPNQPVHFTVGASDPDGDTLTYAWKLDGVMVQTGRDSTYTLIYTDPKNPPTALVCVFSDPGGLKDSTQWYFPFDDVSGASEFIPHQFSLSQNYPNPFNPTTTIEFDLPQEAPVSLEIFSILGTRVRTLLSGVRVNAGRHMTAWDGRDEEGAAVSSGMYLCRLSVGSFHVSRKMTLLK